MRFPSRLQVNTQTIFSMKEGIINSAPHLTHTLVVIPGADAATLSFDATQHIIISYATPVRSEAHDITLRFRTNRPAGIQQSHTHYLLCN